MTEPGRRRLAAVLFSDIKGYSSQMGADEDRTLARLRAHNAIFRAEVDRHGGRVIKTVGDAFMVEFPSSVQAVSCALDVQRALAAHNAAQPPAERLEVRIGVHAGDVLVEGDDLFGETVNLAARLEGKAPPGGVCVTRSVLEQVRRKVDADARDLGVQPLKNLPEPMQLFALTPSATRLELPESAPRASEPRYSDAPAKLALAGLVLVVAGMALAWGLMRLGSRPPERAAAAATGGTLRVGMLVPRGILDVFATHYTSGGVALSAVLEPLVMRSPDGESVPGVLERWEARDGGRTVELTLRAGVFFHDHRCLPGGREATAADVVSSLQAGAKAGKVDLAIVGLADFLAGRSPLIAGVSASGPRSVVVRLEQPSAMPDLTLQQLPLLPAELEACGEDLRNLRQPVGTGPFRFAKVPEGERLGLVRHERYWRKAKDGSPLPRADALELGTSPDAVEALAQLRRGELDLAVFLPDEARAVTELDGNRPRLRAPWDALPLDASYRVARGQAIVLGLLVIPRPGGALASEAVRAALAWSLDREALVGKMPVKLTAFGRFIPPWFAGQAADTKPLGRDVAHAKELLADAGFGPGKPPPEIVVAVYEERRAVADALAAEAKEAGLEVRVVVTNPETAEKGFREKRFDAWLGMSFGGTRGAEPWPFIASYWDTVGTPSLQELGAKVVSEPDRDRRASAYAELELKALRELPVIPIGLAPRDAPWEVVVSSRRVVGLFDPMTGRVEEEPGDFFSRLGVGRAEQ